MAIAISRGRGIEVQYDANDSLRVVIPPTDYDSPSARSMMCHLTKRGLPRRKNFNEDFDAGVVREFASGGVSGRNNWIFSVQNWCNSLRFGAYLI
jgi:hypothetical protein